MSWYEDGYLYHYTDANAILSMIQHRKLWASCHDYLNDGLEARVVPEILGYMANNPDIYHTGGFPEKHRLAFSHHLRRGKLFFVSSFSRRPNMLTQFRMYCPPRGGFVIGFPSDYLAKVGDLVPVRYDRNRIAASCRQYFERYMQRVKELDGKHLAEKTLAYNVDSSGPWVEERCRLAISCKSSEFIAEEEVRMLFKGKDSDILIRPSRGGNVFIPYIEMDLPNEPIQVKIAPGPGTSRQIASSSISWLGRECRRVGTAWTIGNVNIGEFGFREI